MRREAVIPESDRWSPEVEEQWENGIINAREADELERPTPVRIELEAEADKELDRLIDHGFNLGAAGKMLGIEVDAVEEPDIQPPIARRGHARRHPKMRTPADARAADRLPDDQWMLR